MMRNFDRSHFAAAGLGAAAAASSAGAALAEPLGSSDDAKTSVKASTEASTEASAMAARRRHPAPEEQGSRAYCDKAYSAAAIRGGPTKPAASPNRSIITAVRSLVLLVTQAPERTV